MLPQVVAIGKVYQEATTLHNVPLPLDVANVTIERVRVADARVPLPSDIHSLAQTPHSNYTRTSDNNFISLY